MYILLLPEIHPIFMHQYYYVMNNRKMLSENTEVAIPFDSPKHVSDDKEKLAYAYEKSSV